MDKQAVKNKLLYFAFLLSVCAGLILISYYGFLQTIQIDLMDGIQFTYTGENGYAQVSAHPHTDDLNQRIQQFMNTVTYTVEPDENLSNGDTLTVTAQYDASLAADYHFEPTHTTGQFTVEGLPSRYTDVADIDPAFMTECEQAAARYLETEAEPVYGAFLHSDSSSPDRFVWIYETAPDVTTAVFVPEINDASKLNAQAIYSQQAYLNQDELKDKDYGAYLRRLYEGTFLIEPITEQE